jgi:hypothetical protein
LFFEACVDGVWENEFMEWTDLPLAYEEYLVDVHILPIFNR